MKKIIKESIFTSIASEYLHQELEILHNKYKKVGYTLRVSGIDKEYITFEVKFKTGVEFDVPSF